MAEVSWTAFLKGRSYPALMGIVNVTPDSFSDGGRFVAPERAIAHGAALLTAGADILDIGAESTRPGYKPVSAEEEWQRLEAVIHGLSAYDVRLSVDTMKAEVAQKALRAGAHIINDVWGLQADPDMARVAAEHDALVVAMHNRDRVEADLDIRAEWRRFFDLTLEVAQKAGMSSSRIALDPGVGFGKTQQQNVQAIRDIPYLKAEYGLPVLLGASRKSVLGWITGQPADARLAATLSAHLYGVGQGADIVRVHDVREHADAFMTWHIMKERYGEAE
ncbi:dihydropteroate synthase [Neokomagataea thailandica]|uniref:Dihydropteroate synthase n=1 Tax=Neokomagataea tanensis NBRC 106556 TaxID=1223519 RepID=A0ABQ0QL87_9PROT|nr:MULTISPECIES: dihydropteroate synthase [Neokomagataea]GBR49080.1 dihydropteroate synthase [Neokomagataea tanensis NBRC 106556]